MYKEMSSRFTSVTLHTIPVWHKDKIARRMAITNIARSNWALHLKLLHLLICLQVGHVSWNALQKVCIVNKMEALNALDG